MASDTTKLICALNEITEALDEAPALEIDSVVERLVKARELIIQVLARAVVPEDEDEEGE